jgi:hypothetical protein
MPTSKRRKLFIDIEVQVALMWRVVLYWGAFAVAVMLMQFCWIVFTDRPTSSLDLLQRSLTACGPALFASAVLIPLVIVDCLRLSNRFVGPIFRLRRALRDLSQGLPAQPIVLRRDDYWRELADDFNRLVERHAEQEEPHETVAS